MLLVSSSDDKLLLSHSTSTSLNILDGRTVVGVTNKLDLEVVFSFPLTPVPLSLAGVDGLINKTDKSKLMHKLEDKIESTSPDAVDACAVDAMFLIRSMKNLPTTYGAVSRAILSKIMCFGKRVDFVCDTYNSPSIKDIERSAGGVREQ